MRFADIRCAANVPVTCLEFKFSVNHVPKDVETLEVTGSIDHIVGRGLPLVDALLSTNLAKVESVKI